MENDDSKREFQITPPRYRRKPDDETRAWNSAFKQIMYYARTSRAGLGRHGQAGSSSRHGQQEFKQRCAVRVTYASNRTRGQWKGHGHYLTRESATPVQSKNGCGFGPSDQPIPIAMTLGEWQASGDRRLFKLIVSPEFGDRLDLEKLTRDLMEAMEVDLGTRLQWVATVHDNTQYPHVHVALRGARDDGRALRLDREYIKQGIRAIAQDAATAQIGYRTHADAQEAQRREVDQTRFTSLDRILGRNNQPGATKSEESGLFVVDLSIHKDKVRHYVLQARLLFLNSMGLAEKVGRKSWNVRSDFEIVLRAMQRAGDRQRALADHGALLSDNRLQSRVTDITKVEQLEGRVLGHGEEENTGRTYMLLEGTDRNLHFIYHTPEFERARQKGQLKPDSFLRVTTRLVDTKPRITIQDLGDAKRLLANREYFRGKARALISRGILPTEAGIGGWLGRYEVMLAHALGEIENKSRELMDKTKHRER